jgi:hypothetical protein
VRTSTVRSPPVWNESTAVSAAVWRSAGSLRSCSSAATAAAAVTGSPS